MVKNSKAEIKNLSIRDYFLSGFNTLTCNTRTIWQTLLNMQQNLLLTGKPYKMGIVGYCYFNNVASYTHPVISESFAISGFHLLFINDGFR